jgi:hypothetical protein
MVSSVGHTLDAVLVAQNISIGVAFVDKEPYQM